MHCKIRFLRRLGLAVALTFAAPALVVAAPRAPARAPMIRPAPAIAKPSATVYRPPTTTAFNRAGIGGASGVSPALRARAYRQIDQAAQRSGASPRGTRSHPFANDGRAGSVMLPKTSSGGQALNYRTSYVRGQSQTGKTHGINARIVTDPDASKRPPAYLSTHYGQNGGRVHRIQ